jgi:hypothetical protein
MSDHRRSYRKTVGASALVAASGMAALFRASVALRAADAWTAVTLVWSLVAVAAPIVVAWAALVVVGGVISMYRDTLEARGISYAPRQPRERAARPARRVRALLPVLSFVETRPRPLQPGDEVEVRSLDEILATLDDRGMRDGLPFMPEMAAFCGKRFRTLRRVDKLNDWVDHTGLRRVRDTVMLEGLHCDGSAHDGCQARCHLRWNEMWLKRPNGAPAKIHGEREPAAARRTTELDLANCARRIADDGTERYVCQVTELGKGTTPLRASDPRHYARDLWTGNVRLRPLFEGVSIAMFNWVQQRRKGVMFPMISPSAQSGVATPKITLGLEPGELVQVRTKREIEQTLNEGFRNRGLWFDSEMVRFCGGEYRVASRVTRLIEERTGKMLHISNPCVILEGVAASAEYQAFGAQNEPIFWREAWLARASAAQAASGRDDIVPVAIDS